jgi:integrase
MFALAASPAHRKRTGIITNPLAGIARDSQVERTTIVTVEELRRWLAHASYHVRLAIAIAALAPKLRLANVLALTWRDHLDPALQYITVMQHKTVRATGRPLVVPIVPQLRQILEDARRRNRGEYVVAYRGRPLASIRGGLDGAATRAGLHYGLKDGITFHTIRHAMATLLAELREPEAIRKELMGHVRIETTQRYTHLRPMHQVAPLERLSDAMPIADLVTNPRRRALSKGSLLDLPPGGKNGGTASETDGETLGKRGNSEKAKPEAESVDSGQKTRRKSR